MKSTRINFALKSTKGKRAINQDSVVCTFNYNSDFIAIVCDGVGSVKHSEVASQMMCKIFATEFENTKKIEKPIIWAKNTLDIAMKRLAHRADENNTPNISTTLAMLMVVEGKYYALNIGDTRVYGITKDKKVKQLTEDHNYYNYLVKRNVRNWTLNNNKNKWLALTRYIDPSKPEKAKFDYKYGESEEFRYFLICTDGLYAHISPEKIAKVANRKIFPLACRGLRLNNIALASGSKDNVSNILVSCRTYGK